MTLFLHWTIKNIGRASALRRLRHNKNKTKQNKKEQSMDNYNNQNIRENQIKIEKPKNCSEIQLKTNMN